MKNDSTPTCHSCSYDLTGLPLHENKIHCPECDTTATPIHITRPFSKRDMHARFASRLLAPTTLPTALSLIAAPVFPAVLMGSCVMIAAIPMLLVILSMTTTRSIRQDAQIPPVQISPPAITLWSWIYIAPGVVLWSIYIRVVF
jgi:hypothetical protein